MANQPIAITGMLDTALLYKNIFSNTFAETSQKISDGENVMSIKNFYLCIRISF